MKKIFVVACIIGAMLLAQGSAQAVVGVAGPGAEAAGFATPAIVVPKGQGLTFVNTDPASYNHNLWAFDTFLPTNSAPWCSGFPHGRCPAFWSQTISAGGVTPVEGVPALKAGQYKFWCSLHDLMIGTLVIA